MENLDRIYLTAGIISAASLIVLFIPSSVFLFSFSGISFLAGEFWRIITFPFVHSSGSHFFENMVTLFLAAVLAKYSGMKNKEFLSAFFISGLIVAFADIAFFPTMVIAGASLGIFAVLGAVSSKGTDFIPHYLLIAILFSTVFIKYLIECISAGAFLRGIILDQAGLHLSGFFAGILIIYILGLHECNKRVLTWNE